MHPPLPRRPAAHAPRPTSPWFRPRRSCGRWARRHGDGDGEARAREPRGDRLAVPRTTPEDAQGRRLDPRPARPQPAPAADPRAVGAMADEFVELHGDRLFGDDPAIVGGFARIGGRRVVVVGQQKGAGHRGEHPPQLRHAAPRGLPQGDADHGAGGALRAADRDLRGRARRPPRRRSPRSAGIAEAIARSVGLMTRLRTPIVTVITGEGGSGGALAHRRRRRGARPRERGLLGHQPGGLRAHPVAHVRRGPDGRVGDEDDRRRTSWRSASWTRSSRSRARARTPITRRRPAASRTSSSRSWTASTAIPVDELVEQRYRRYRALGPYTEIAAPPPTPPEPPRRGLADRLRDLLEAGQRAIPAPLQVGRRDEPPAREEV